MTTPTSIYLLTNHARWALAYCDTKDQAHDLAPWTHVDAFLLSGSQGTCTDTADKMAQLAASDFMGVFKQPPPTKTYQLVTVQVLFEGAYSQVAGDYVRAAMAYLQTVVKVKINSVTPHNLTEIGVKEMLQ